MRLVATATKICTSTRSSKAHAYAFDASTTPPYTPNVLFWRSDIGTSLERHPFSGLVHSAGELLHTP